MPQLHHRDPSIIGLLGASPHLYSPTAITSHLPCDIQDPLSFLENSSPLIGSQNSSPASLEAFPTIPSRKGTLSSGAITPLNVSNKKSRPSLHLEKGQIADMGFERPYYGLIVDGVHCHPNSVRVCILLWVYF
jgi:N-acetylglucosamine-6-phosphate deacetylase